MQFLYRNLYSCELSSQHVLSIVDISIQYCSYAASPTSELTPELTIDLCHSFLSPLSNIWTRPLYHTSPHFTYHYLPTHVEKARGTPFSKNPTEWILIIINYPVPPLTILKGSRYAAVTLRRCVGGFGF
jgi:hypothetical protein